MHHTHNHVSLFQRALSTVAFLTFSLITLFAFAITPVHGAPQATVTWQDNSPDPTNSASTGETGFEVERQDAGGEFIRIFTTGPNITTYTDTSILANVVYAYRIRAISTVTTPPLVSSYSNITAPFILDTLAPSTPGSFVASNLTTSSLTLTWAVANDAVGVTSYRVSRNGTTLKTVTTPTATDSNLTPGTAYTYTVVALDAAGNVSPAATLNVTTLVPPAPIAPSNAKAVVVP